ncbi:MAG TPA: GAF domain-containing protein, partial [bacterium]|nr:GAF domain-containing protein [bacterium]
KIHIPSSVEEILIDKFNKLEPSQQSLLRWLSVNDEALRLEDLQALCEGQNVQADLLVLIEKDILEKTSREHTYFFRNLLFVDVVYKLIPKIEIPLCHDRLATITEDNPQLYVRHLHHLGHGSRPEIAQKALAALGGHYLQEAEYDEAIQTFLKLIKLQHNAINGNTVSGYFSLGRAYFNSRLFDKAITTYQHIKEVLSKNFVAENIENLILAFNCLVESHLKIANFDQALKEIEAVKPYLKQSRQKLVNQLKFRNYSAYILIRQNNIAEAEISFRETHQIWLNQLSPEEKQKVLNNRLIEVYLIQQKYDLVIHACEENITFLQQTNCRCELAHNYYMLGEVFLKIIATQEKDSTDNLIQKCVENFLSCEKVAREINDFRIMYSAFNGLGNLYNTLKDFNKALDYYKRALNVVRKVNEPVNAAAISYNIGYILGRNIQFRDAFSYMIYAINTLEGLQGNYSPHREDFLFLSYQSLAEIHAECNEPAKGHKALDKAEAVINQHEFMQYRAFWKEVRRAHLFIIEQNQKEADTYLEKAKTIAKNEDEKTELSKMRELYVQTFASQTTQPTGITIMSTNTQNTSNEDIKKIIEINRFINSEYDTDQLLKIVLNYAIQLSNAESGIVLLLNQEGELVVRATLNTSAADQEKISMSVAKMALEKGEIITSSDALSDERFDSSESIVLNELKSVLCLPIRSKYKSVGVFYLDNRYRTNAFENCNVDLLNAFCDQVGISLENSKLINELLGAKQQLQSNLEKTTAELTEVKNILKSECETYQTKYAYQQIIAKSPKMQEIFKLLDKITETNLSIFIHGESGTGKELVAKALH